MNGNSTVDVVRENVISDLRRGTLRLGRRLRAERPAGALSANKIAVLAHLRRTGPSTPGAIADAERQRPQSLTRVFTELERDGLITRSPSTEDRRASVLPRPRPGSARSPPTWPTATPGCARPSPVSPTPKSNSWASPAASWTGWHHRCL